MSRHGGGDKRSSLLTFQRRLFLVRRLMRGPAPSATLIAEARSAFGADIYPPDAAAALRHDLAALRGEFECVIERTQDGYRLEDSGRLVLLDLSDVELEALAYLSASYEDSQMPNAAQVAALLHRIAGLLPAERRVALARSSPLPRLDQPVATATVADKLLAQLKQVANRQQIEFDYRSSFAPRDVAVRHFVSPYNVIYRDGHTYLEAYCHECGIAELIDRYTMYRLDRIVTGSLRILPTRLPPGRMPQHRYELIYRLSPRVAVQRDIALWFPDSRVSFAEDGSALITAYTGDLWQARQILLRYREHCRVLDPPELISLMRESITLMERLYSQQQGSSKDVDHDNSA